MVVWNLCKKKGLGFGFASLLTLLSCLACQQSSPVNSVQQAPTGQNTTDGELTDSNSLTNHASDAENQTLTQETSPDLKGIGPIRVGMTVDEASQRSGVPLISPGEQSEPPECLYYHPLGEPRGLLFMVSNGQIVRVDIQNRMMTTLSGVAVGDTEEHIQSLYPDQIEVSSHKYVPGGHYLTFVPRDEADKDYRVIFETDPEERVVQMRSGRLPEVEYVEGCS